MSRLLIFVEGKLEETVIVNFLQPYWSKRFNEANAFSFGGSGLFKRDFVRDTHSQLRSAQDLTILCLIDLYKEPFELYRGTKSREQGFIDVKDHMYSLIDPRLHPRFGAFPIVMELETWLCADYKIVERLGGVLHPKPEQIEHPAEYLVNLVKAKRGKYHKYTDGKNLFGLASPKRVYEDNCPHFKELIHWVENPPDSPAKISGAREKQFAERDAIRKQLEQQLQQADDMWMNEPTDENMSVYLAANHALEEHDKHGTTK